MNQINHGVYRHIEPTAPLSRILHRRTLPRRCDDLECGRDSQYTVIEAGEFSIRCEEHARERCAQAQPAIAWPWTPAPEPEPAQPTPIDSAKPRRASRKKKAAQ